MSKITDPKNLRIGQNFTVKGKPGETSIYDGDRYRVQAICLPFVYIEEYNPYKEKGNRFGMRSTPVDTRKLDIIRLSVKAVPN